LSALGKYYQEVKADMPYFDHRLKFAEGDQKLHLALGQAAAKDRRYGKIHTNPYHLYKFVV
jgi:hypothetical protein